MTHPSPWMTRREAATHLRCSTDTIDRQLVEMKDGPQDGKMRYQLAMIGTIKRVRILAADVYAILPLPEGESEEVAA